MKSLAYTNFFNKEISHEDALKAKVKSELINIMSNELSISEKDFKMVDILSEKATKLVNKYYDKINKLYNSNKRIPYIAELLYDEHDYLLEKKSEFEKLQDNKVPLSKDEREIVRNKKAEWSNGDSAVWKSDKDGNITYVTNTHRAYNTAKSLDTIIKKFHNFIKGTA